MVTEVRRLADSEQALREAKPIELPLAWTRSNPPLTVAAVHPGSERHINVLYVDGPGRDDTEIARKWSETMPAQFDLHPKPAGGRDMLEPGQLRDRGRGSRPQLGRHRYDIPVSWDGKWSGKADMWDHLRERREAAAGHRQHERRVDRARLDGSEPSPRAAPRGLCGSAFGSRASTWSIPAAGSLFSAGPSRRGSEAPEQQTAPFPQGSPVSKRLAWPTRTASSR